MLTALSKTIRMTMMTIKRTLLTFIIVSAGAIAFAQENDFGLWYGASAEHKLPGRLKLELSACLRTFDNASKIEQIYLEAGLSYRLNKYIDFEGSYRITRNIEDDDSYHIRHKWFLGAKGSFSAGDFSFSARIRFQERYKTYFEDEEDKIPDSHIRCRLKTLYDIPSFPVNPYLSAEVFLPVFGETTRTVDKNRFTAGAEYNFSKKQSVELEYIFQRDYLPKMSDIDIISLSYKLEF